MKLSELKGKSVVTVAEARKIGVVEDVLVDPSYGKIAGLRLKGQGNAPNYFVANADVRAIGRDAVTITGQNAVQSIDRARDLASLPSLGAVVHSRVVSDEGRLLGTINEIDIDEAGRQVRGFEYTHGAMGGLLGRQRILDIQDVVGVGAGLVTVRESPPEELR